MRSGNTSHTQAIELMRILEMPATTWLHVLYVHTPEFCRVLGGLLWCGNWQLEGSHKITKRSWDRTPKRGGRGGGRKTCKIMLQRAGMKPRLQQLKHWKEVGRRGRCKRRSPAFHKAVEQALAKRLKRAGVAYIARTGPGGRRGWAL